MTATFIQIGDKVMVHVSYSKLLDLAVGKVRYLNIGGTEFHVVTIDGNDYRFTTDELELLDRCEDCGEKLQECEFRDGFYYTCHCKA